MNWVGDAWLPVGVGVFVVALATACILAALWRETYEPGSVVADGLVVGVFAGAAWPIIVGVALAALPLVGIYHITRLALRVAERRPAGRYETYDPSRRSGVPDE